MGDWVVGWLAYWVIGSSARQDGGGEEPDEGACAGLDAVRVHADEASREAKRS